MEQFNLYFNFYSIGTFVASLFAAIGAIFLFSVKNASKSTKYLGAVFLFFFPANGALFISTALLDPIAAYHRWFVVPGILFSFVLIIQFVFRFPNNDQPILTRIVYTLTTLLAIIVTTIFYHDTYNANIIFNPRSHIYDFAPSFSSKLTANTAMALLFVLLVSTIYRVIRIKEKSRFSLLMISLTFIISMLVPTITNIQSLLGKIDRGTHMLVFVFLSILGWFTILIIYINSTTDKTSLMTKIVGTSMVTILLLVQIISYIIIEIKERDFDKLYSQKVARFIYLGDDAESFYYKASSNLKTNSQEIIFLSNFKDKNLLKEGIFKELSSFNFPNPERGFRQFEDKLITTYKTTNLESSINYEVGFDYRRYREFISEAAFKIVVITVTITLAVMFIFPLFFYFNLVRPLDSLLSGVDKVNHGNLDIQVPVEVIDEIGFLSQSFNNMVISIKEAKAKLQDYAENLEKMVDERTRELQETLQKVESLKKQQDGDYYLTSLLIKPLGKNNIDSENFHVEFFSKQKKQFKFKKWDSEIGGDLNIAHTITLRGKKFNVILNADAMGKSIQGAGGALVLGAVFQSIIERTKVSSNVQNLFPERWLKNSFIELQNVFTSFDGTMLVSMIFTIIDDDSGVMYYINAEHPDAVLLRDNKASFLESHVFRKVGMTETPGNLSVGIFHFQPGDIIYLGSDGRDDILLERNGERFINEDENLFLRALEKAEGDINKVVQILQEYGEITDDLSLIRISYNEQVGLTLNNEILIEHKKELAKARRLLSDNQKKEALEILYKTNAQFPNFHILREIIKILIRDRKYKEVIKFLDNYINIRPMDTEYIYLASFCYKKIGNYPTALDLAERVRLRSPNNVKYLANLADIYILMNNEIQVNKIIKKLAQLDSDGRLTEKLKRKAELTMIH